VSVTESINPSHSHFVLLHQVDFRQTNNYNSNNIMSRYRPPQSVSVSLQLYYVVSGLFFAASAYAQLNDPDPFYWVTGYLIAGCGMQILPRVHGSSYALYYSRLVARSISTVNALLLVIFVRIIIPQLDFSKPMLEFGWNFLELEEGREIVGLLLLFLHGLFVQSSQFVGDESSLSDNNNNNKTAPPGEQQLPKLGGLLQTVGLLVAFSLLGLALYLWIYYQPAMVAKYQTAHCAGQFHDPLVPALVVAVTDDPTASQRGGGEEL
jgi:Transmembrane family 220, helix